MSGARYRLPVATQSEEDGLRSQNLDIAGMGAMKLVCELRAVRDALVDIEVRGLRQRTVWVGRFPVGERCWLTDRERILRRARTERSVAR